VAVAVRNWKADTRRDLGGDLSRAQETLLEVAAQTWVLVSTCDDYIARQPDRERMGPDATHREAGSRAGPRIPLGEMSTPSALRGISS
jgi:hypothetical protein